MFFLNNYSGIVVFVSHTLTNTSALRVRFPPGMDIFCICGNIFSGLDLCPCEFPRRTSEDNKLSVPAIIKLRYGDV